MQKSVCVGSPRFGAWVALNGEWAPLRKKVMVFLSYLIQEIWQELVPAAESTFAEVGIEGP